MKGRKLTASMKPRNRHKKYGKNNYENRDKNRFEMERQNAIERIVIEPQTQE